MSKIHSFVLTVSCCCFISLFVGCGPTVEDRLTGKWKGTLELDEAAVAQKVGQASDPVSAMVGKAAILTLSKSLSFEMNLLPDGKFESESRINQLSEKSSGTWAVKSSDKSQATISVTEKSGTREYVVLFDPDFMAGTGGFSTPTWGEAQGLGQVRFTRVTP